MLIEQLLPPSGRQKLWQVQFEDGSILPVSEEVLLDFSLGSGMELEEEALSRLQEAQMRAQLRKQAMAMLLRRPYSKGELRRRLVQGKGAAPAQVDEICDWAEEVGLLNEAAYAAMIVRRYQERGFGLYKIKNELYRHDIPRDLWDAALSELEGSEAAIDRYLARHLKSTEPRDLKKAADALARRGFSWTEIAAGIRRHGGPDGED